MSEQAPQIHTASDGGITASHPLTIAPSFVAPNLAKEHNTFKLAIVPFACWRANDMRFHFDSSLVLPEIKEELKDLKSLIDKHTQNDANGRPTVKPALTVFGHADPTGSDDYNKSLAGRRAAAIYALLTRRDDIWEDLYKDTGQFALPVKGDKWTLASIQVMLQACGFDPGRTDGRSDDPTTAAIKKFQTANSLSPDGDPGPQTRKKLYLAYMDKICVQIEIKLTADAIDSLAETFPPAVITRLKTIQDQVFLTPDDLSAKLTALLTPQELADHQAAITDAAQSETTYKLPADHFLGSGKDKTGKADFQGCGEFNPVFIFSQQQDQDFKDAAKKTARDKANEPNRRVLIFLFRPGLRIDPSVWPCPRAKEGSDGCKKRFFSDGDTRRKPAEEERSFENDGSTFACRFYDRLANKSPCERTVRTVRIKVYDALGKVIANAPFEFTAEGRSPVTGKTASSQGIVTVNDVAVPTRAEIKWGFPAKPPIFSFSLKLFLDLDDELTERASRRRLNNLGYTPDDKDPAADVESFQFDYGHLANPRLTVDGKLDDATMKHIRAIHDSATDDLRHTQPDNDS